MGERSHQRQWFTPGQRAQLAQEVAAARAKAIGPGGKLFPRQASENARRRAEVELAARLLPHIADESAIDRGEHALAVARVVLEARAVDSPCSVG